MMRRQGKNNGRKRGRERIHHIGREGKERAVNMGIGAGSEMLQPLAIAIVSGLIVQMPLVLILLPVLVRIFTQLKREGDSI